MLAAFLSEEAIAQDMAGNSFLIDPATRDAALASPALVRETPLVRALILYALRDPRFFDAMFALGDISPVLNETVPRRASWFLGNERLRDAAVRRGWVDYWQEHGLPDYCDGTLEIWICKLEVRQP